MNGRMRILAVDDSPIDKTRKLCDCIGVLSNGSVTEGIIRFRIERDGSDATEKLIEAVRKGKFPKLIKLVMTHSVTMGGLNILDIKKLNGELHVPVLCVTRERPHALQLQEAIRKVYKDPKVRKVKLLALKGAGEIHQYGNLHFQFAGMGREQAESVLKGYESYPWNLRLAHLIASALVRGESHGKA